MYYEVEKSGCCERKGMVQIRFSFYLEPGDYGYEKHCVQMPEIPEEGYPDIVEMGNSESEKAFNVWIEALPKKWQNNPFHNHFCCYDSDVTKEKIQSDGKRFLEEAFTFWKQDQFPNIKNSRINWPKDPKKVKSVCEAKIMDLTSDRIWGR